MTSIVFGALALRPHGSGVQTYQRELIHALTKVEGLPSFSAVVQKDSVGALPPEVKPVTRPVGSGTRRAVEGLRPVPAMLFHSLDVDLPLAQKGLTVSTVHDMSVFDTPWAMSKFRARGEQLLLRRSLKRADSIIAVSQFTAERIKALTGRDSTVTPLAPAAWTHIPDEASVNRVREKYNLPKRFVFQLGTLEPRKRPDVVNDALRGLGVPLVLAGGGTDGPKRPAGSIGLGYVDREDIPALYRAASVVAYASSYEGFGLPPVEAMACGAVVVASAVGGIPEAVGSGACVVKRLRTSEWRASLSAALNDAAFRSSLLDDATLQVASLNWQATARSTAQVYAEML